LVKTYFADGNHTGSVTNIFTAGFETTSNALLWMFYELGRNTEAYKQIAQEVRALEENHSYTDLIENIPFTTACFNEALRLYPPAWVNGRTATSEFEVGDLTIPKTAEILISPFLMHRLPKYWENPREFEPQRFLKDSFNKKAFIPFGGGPRACLGERIALMEAYLITVSILREFDFTLENSDISPQFHFTLSANSQLLLNVKHRGSFPQTGR